MRPAPARASACWNARTTPRCGVLVRFLHLQRRTVQGVSPETGELHDVGTLDVDGTEYTRFDEAAEREQRLTALVSELLAGDCNTEFHIGPGEAAEEITDERGRVAGRLLRQWSALDGVIRLHAERVAGPYQALRLQRAGGQHHHPAG